MNWDNYGNIFALVKIKLMRTFCSFEDKAIRFKKFYEISWRIIQAETKLIEYSKVLESSGILSPLSFNSSIYNSMASLAIAMASSISSPWVMHPGKAGTVTVNPPSSAYCKWILYVYMIILKIFVYLIYSFTNIRVFRIYFQIPDIQASYNKIISP